MLLEIPFPSAFGDKLWSLGPLFYFLVVACLLLMAALTWTMISLRKAESDRVNQAMERVKSAKELEEFMRGVELIRREEVRYSSQDARENLKVLTGLSNILDRMSRDSERNTSTLREDIAREAQLTKSHVTVAISNLQNHLEKER